MTIQDYMMKQAPLKMQAEMALKQGNYQLAADKIYEFAVKCGEADQHFSTDDTKTDQVMFIGYNSAALIFNQVLDATATPIINPASNNPYQTEITLAQQSMVPKIIAESGLSIAYIALVYASLIYGTAPTGTTAMGFLNAATLFCNMAFYHNYYKNSDILNESLEYLEEATQAADVLMSRFASDANISGILRNYYHTAGNYYQHYATCCGDMDRFLDFQIKGVQLLQKALSIS